MEPRRYLRCMGQPSLFAPSGEPIRFRTKKHLALLIYLTVEAKPQRRERLAELLWPRVSPTEGRHSLATALSTLRPRLGPEGLETSRDYARLTPGRVDMDLDRLEAGDILGTEVTAPLEVAAFLDGFDIVDSSEFNHWRDRQQARLLPAIKDALVVLIDRCRRTGDSRQIERLADRMLALDDLSEEAIRAKMEARAFAGDRLTALEFFEEWKKKLADELHAVPSDLVEGMAVRLRRRGWERTTATNIPTVPTDQWRGRPFIGRAAEYRVLYELWESVQRCEPGHALILGDSGVGKTTLVEKLTTAAGLEGAAISRVQCYDLEREIPYSTVSSLILGLLDRPGVSATSPESLAELARTIPEVRHRFPNIPASSDSQGEAARIRLTEAFHEMLAMVAEEHPVVLVVDDLHLADDVSLSALHLMMRRARGQPIMVLLIARPGELPQSPQAAKLRMAAGALGIREIDLLPLADDESLELLRSLIPTDQAHPSLAAQRALLRAAAGYPMVLEFLVQDWQESGERSAALSVDAMTTEPGSGRAAGVAFRDILARITRSLDPTTYNVLNVAAILGHRLNDMNMYTLVDLSLGQTMAAMAELVSRRVLRDGATGLEFVNEMVRAAAYVGVPTTLRKVLHGKIADRFAEMDVRSGEAPSLEIAWHCIRAGRAPEATPYLLRGAREAIRSGSPYAAERGLSTALPNLRDQDKTEALVLLAEALQEQSRWEESLAALDQMGSTEHPASPNVALFLRTRARRRLGYIESEELADLPRKLLTFIESSADKSSSIRAAVEAASVLNTTGHPGLAPAILERLLSMDAQDLELDDIAHLLLAKAMLFYSVQNLGSSLSCIAEATALLESQQSPNSALAMFHQGRGAILTKQGAYQGSIAAYLQCHQTASRVGNDAIGLQASANLALSLLRLGEYRRALDWADRALACGSRASAPYCLPAMYGAVLSCAMLGRADQAETAIRRGTQDFGNFGSPAGSQAWALYSADGFAMLGKREEAEQEGWRATSGVNSHMHMDRFAGPYARWAAITSVYPGRMSHGHRTLDSMVAKLESYDAIDRAEILNAKAWLSAKTGEASAQQVARMCSYLKVLPPAVTDQLGRMGMLDFY